MRISKFVLGALLSMGLVASAAAGPLINDNAAQQFSATTNPNGNWQYGYKSLGGGLGGTFNAYTAKLAAGGWDHWYNSSSVFKNTSGSAVATACCNPLPADGMGAHPGSGGEFAVLRWTAPNAGSFTVNAWFAGGDSSGTSTDVHVVFNSVSLFDALVNGGLGLDQENYSGTIAMQAGDVLDFMVGFGSNGTYWSDTTRLNAVVSGTSATSGVPEPAPMALVAIGIVAAGLARRRRVA